MGVVPVTPKSHQKMLELAKRVEQVIGYIPAGTDFLEALAHPEVAEYTQEWWETVYCSGCEGCPHHDVLLNTSEEDIF